MQNRAASDRPRVLLTGAGSIGRRHAHNIRELVPGAELFMVATRDETRRWVSQFEATPVESVAAGLELAPQIAVVCSVSAQHGSDLGALMEADALEALYIEKPVVIDAASLRVIGRRIETGWNLPTVVGCNLRYLGALNRLKAACESAEAGRIARASLQVGQWLPDWRAGRDYRQSYSAHRDQGGGVIFDLVHEIDSAAYLFGEIARGQAAASRRSGLEIDSDDAATIVLSMKSGLPVQVALDYVSRQPVREYRVVGDRGTLRLDMVARQLTLLGADAERPIDTQASDWDMAATYKLAMQDLLNAWRTGSGTRYDLQEAMHVTRWMIDLEASAWRPRAGAAA
ncbi:MAG: Gfo/Idh/MocA family oxidoreductase [Pseudomonadota bacterium]